MKTFLTSQDDITSLAQDDNLYHHREVVHALIGLATWTGTISSMETIKMQIWYKGLLTIYGVTHWSTQGHLTTLTPGSKRHKDINDWRFSHPEILRNCSVYLNGILGFLRTAFHPVTFHTSQHAPSLWLLKSDVPIQLGEMKQCSSTHITTDLSICHQWSLYWPQLDPKQPYIIGSWCFGHSFQSAYFIIRYIQRTVVSTVRFIQEGEFSQASGADNGLHRSKVIPGAKCGLEWQWVLLVLRNHVHPIEVWQYHKTLVLVQTHRMGKRSAGTLHAGISQDGHLLTSNWYYQPGSLSTCVLPLILKQPGHFCMGKGDNTQD